MSYDAFASTFSKSRKNLRWGEIEYFIEYIKKQYGETPIHILDIGCGNGRFIESLKISGLPYSYLGIDESSGMIREAKIIHPTEVFEVLNMNHLEKLENNNKFDVVVFIASFHHLHNAVERDILLGKLKKILKPTGIIMMINWNLMGKTLFEKYETSYKGDGDFGIKIGAYERYYHGFTIHELEKLFQKNNFKIEENRVFENEKNIISILRSI